MVDALSVLRPVVDTLDGLGLAACVFDENDATLLWNRSFLKFFPEHAADIHVGEPYRAHLRRFYQCRLSAEEMPSMEHRIEEGVVRHRTQQRAFVFEHRGVKITVSSLPMPGVGRIRIWQQQAETGGVIDRIAGAMGAVAEGGDAAFDAVADGIMVTGADDRITSVNEAFAAMYGVHDRATAVGARFEDIVRAAWRRAETEQAAQEAAVLLKLRLIGVLLLLSRERLGSENIRGRHLRRRVARAAGKLHLTQPQERRQLVDRQVRRLKLIGEILILRGIAELGGLERLIEGVLVHAQRLGVLLGLSGVCELPVGVGHLPLL